jgi:DNA-binding response OmpR family regulator
LATAAQSGPETVDRLPGSGVEPVGELADLSRIALLDDDSGFLLVLSKRLERRDLAYRKVGRRVSANAVARMEIDALIIDPAVLGPRAWEWLERLCELRPELGIVVCTASSTVAERVQALRLGVDDWLSKPCHPEELVARVEAVTLRGRRPEPPSTEPVLIGEVTIRPDQYQAFVGGESLRLTRREYQLMSLLARSPWEVHTREALYECLWGYEMVRNDRSVDVFVHKLRRKLEQASPAWRYIHTHFGVGYELGAEPLEAGSVSTLELPELGPETVLETLAA